MPRVGKRRRGWRGVEWSGDTDADPIRPTNWICIYRCTYIFNYIYIYNIVNMIIRFMYTYLYIYMYKSGPP